MSYMFGELLFFVGIMYFLPFATVASDHPSYFPPQASLSMIGIPFSFKNHPVQKIKLAKLAEAWLEPDGSKLRAQYRKMASFCKLFSMMDALDAFVLIIGIIGGNLPSLIGFIQGGNMGPFTALL